LTSAAPAGLPFLVIQNKEAAEVTKPMNADGSAGQGNTSTPGGAPGAAPAEQGSSPFGLFVPLLIMFAVLYFVILRPERKRQKEAAALRSALKKGDKVLLTSGMVGTIASIADDWVVVEIADKVRVQFQKSAVAQVVDNKEKAETPATVKS
jgi:preprotein translocase subunit YajC